MSIRRFTICDECGAEIKGTVYSTMPPHPFPFESKYALDFCCEECMRPAVEYLLAHPNATGEDIWNAHVRRKNEEIRRATK